MGLSQSNIVDKKMTQTSKGKQEFDVNVQLQIHQQIQK